MMLNIDFAERGRLSLRQLRMLLLVVITLMVLLLIYRLMVLQSGAEELVKVANEIELTEHTLGGYAAGNGAVFVRDYAEMSRRVSMLNAMTGSTVLPPGYVLATLEKLLPKDVMLNQYVQKSRADSVNINISSSDSLSLTAFVHNLEAVEEFEQVLIVRQSRDGNGDLDTHAYDIRLTLK